VLDADSSAEKACFSITVNMLEAYKVKIQNEASEGRTSVEVPVELVLYLISRAQAWEGLEHNERVHYRSNP